MRKVLRSYRHWASISTAMRVLREPSGDTINLAARLRRMTHRPKVNHLLNQVTREAGPEHVTREIGLVQVRGEDQALVVAHVRRWYQSLEYERFCPAIPAVHDGSSPELALAPFP